MSYDFEAAELVIVAKLILHLLIILNDPVAYTDRKHSVGDVYLLLLLCYYLGCVCVG